MIVITMYNEDAAELIRTLTGVFNNLYNFEQEKLDPRKVGVVVVVDGRTKINPSIKKYGQMRGF